MSDLEWLNKQRGIVDRGGEAPDALPNMSIKKQVDKKLVFLIVLMAMGAVSAVFNYQAKKEAERLEKIAAIERAANEKIERQRVIAARREASEVERRNKPQVAERNIVEDAYTMCAVLRSGGATTCDVKTSVWSGSFIDATVAVSPQQAAAICRQVALLTGKAGSPFIGAAWDLKLFSPLGSDRPMAVCKL